MVGFAEERYVDTVGRSLSQPNPSMNEKRLLHVAMFGENLRIFGPLSGEWESSLGRELHLDLTG